MNDLLDDGMYIAAVKKAEIVDSEYMITQYNKTGTCLNLWLDAEQSDEDRTKRLFKRMNPTEANRLFKLYNKPSVQDLYDSDPSFLNGKNVILEVKQYTSKAGKTSNIVVSVSPCEETKTTKVNF